MSSHVIGAILHVNRSADAQPWPLAIEGYDGRTHELLLEPGEMLLYESTKLLHGRPRPFRGSWFASMFAHFKPVGWLVTYDDTQLALPPGWHHDTRSGAPHTTVPGSASGVPALVVGQVGAWFEPECRHSWCGLTGIFEASGVGAT